jgi:hypothetical protein
LHDDDANVLDVKLEIIVVVKGIGRRGGRSRRSREERKDLVIAVLVQVLGVRKQQVAGVRVFLDGFQ